MLQFARFYGHSVLRSPLHAGSVVVDLGSNRGAFATAVWEVVGCRPYCAEPNPGLYAGLARHPGLRAHHVAIGPRSGRVAFQVAEHDECSSLFRPARSVVSSQIECDALTLADFLERLGVERVDLLKVDIEGAELEVLGGAAPELLARIDQIAVEFHETVGLGTAQEVREQIRRLHGFGFRVVKGSFTDFSDVLFVHPGRLGLRGGWGCHAQLWRFGNGLERRLDGWRRPHPKTGADH